MFRQLVNFIYTSLLIFLFYSIPILLIFSSKTLNGIDAQPFRFKREMTSDLVNGSSFQRPINCEPHCFPFINDSKPKESQTVSRQLLCPVWRQL